MAIPWVRLDTGFPDNPKVLELLARKRPTAVVAFICGIAWCGRQETAGAIPRTALPFLHATKRDAADLVSVRLWLPTEIGWQVKDFDEYQQTNVTSADRSRAGRKASCKRWHPQPCTQCGFATEETPE